jgi:DNA polymerase elongation subunit (family B)
VFESDFNPLERCLSDVYSKLATPELNIGFTDIECDVTKEGGFCNVENAYAPINAITVYESAKRRFHTMAVPPQGWTGTLPAHLDFVILCKNEEELLTRFLDILHPIDVITGWNSEFFDVPYIAKRVELVLGEAAMYRLGFEGAIPPKWAEKERFKGGKKEPVLNIGSRVHLDYLLLYKKFDLTKRQSYTLDNVAFEELGENKIDYEGTLWELYNNNFIKFLDYNIHDVRLITLLDKKRQYIELANQMVHGGSVNFDQIYGSVNLIAGSVINYCHNMLNMVVIDAPELPEMPPVEGALVMTPTPGFYEWIGACDINSLYPSSKRSLNLSPEKIVGQLLGHEADWHKIFKARKNPQDAECQDATVSLLIEGNTEPIEIAASELNAILIESRYAITGYGTILDQGNGKGIVPAVLEYWFTDRKRLQAEKKKFAKEARKLLEQGVKVVTGQAHPELIMHGDIGLTVEQNAQYIRANEQAEYFDMLQGVRKVLLNSEYGASLNRFYRFGDPRLGASTTFSGRQITTFMMHTITDFVNPGGARVIKTSTHEKDGSITNDYSIDIIGNAGVIYGDTDSAYFTMRGLVDNEDDAIILADAVGAEINNTFPTFMQEAFNCQPGFETLIKSNRELVCRSGIFQAKKKYLVSVIDKEGVRIAKGSDDELKTMGSAIRLSSTPNAIREFLTSVVMPILHKDAKTLIDKIVIEFRKQLETGILSPLELATVNSINGLEEATILYKSFKKMPSHQNAKAGLAYNIMLEKLGIKEPPISSGDKCKIFYIEPNAHNFDVIAFPSETEHLPTWFNDNFRLNMKKMQDKLIDANLKLIFDPLGWEVPTFQSELVNSLLEF